MLTQATVDLGNLKKMNVKLHADSDAIVQGTKNERSPENDLRRHIARDIRDLCASIDEKIATVGQAITGGFVSRYSSAFFSAETGIGFFEEAFDDMALSLWVA